MLCVSWPTLPLFDSTLYVVLAFDIALLFSRREHAGLGFIERCQQISDRCMAGRSVSDPNSRFFNVSHISRGPDVARQAEVL